MMSGYESYKNNSVMTAKPEELTLMLYEGAIKFNNQAMVAIDEKNMQEAHRLITKVEDIILEFKSTLNMDYEVSKNMYDMYDYIYRRLTEANVKKDKSALVEIHEYLQGFRDTWKEAMTKSNADVVNA